MDAKPNRGNKAAFSNFSGQVWALPLTLFRFVPFQVYVIYCDHVNCRLKSTELQNERLRKFTGCNKDTCSYCENLNGNVYFTF